jgi:hypothetical protein
MDDETKRKIKEDPDFIDSPRNENSLAKLLSKKPDGVDEKTIAKVLGMTEEEVHDTVISAIEKMRKVMKV